MSSAFLLSTAVGGSLQKKNFKEIAVTGIGSSNKVGKLGQAKSVKADY